MPLEGSVKHIFLHSWKDVFLASWKKYPSHRRPDILSIDLINKEFDPEAQVLTTTRIVSIKSNMPAWLQPILGGSMCWFLEEARIDMKNNTMTLLSKNLSFETLIRMDEGIIYKPLKANPAWTSFEQHAKVSAFVFGVSRKMEEFAFSRFYQNADIGKDILETVVQTVEVERKASEVWIEAAQFASDAAEMASEKIIEAAQFARDAAEMAGEKISEAVGIASEKFSETAEKFSEAAILASETVGEKFSEAVGIASEKLSETAEIASEKFSETAEMASEKFNEAAMFASETVGIGSERSFFERFFLFE
eukprot:TRINITY_DN159_c0_g1_i1.p1 TRINITY_DN159_c0_g1~~TRINITY_DN159_c0_g1_i1.p1  ORF type:complete len:307 (+),score=62.55 TRINITY_DN159_c0_g1_i1:131-1051(+)